MEGFVRAATNPLRSSSVMTGDGESVELSLISFSLDKAGMRGLIYNVYSRVTR
jgi:hypothetical protein